MKNILVILCAFVYSVSHAQDIEEKNALSRLWVKDTTGGHLLYSWQGRRLGIGTSLPTHKLTVVGDGRFTGSLTVGGDHFYNGNLYLTNSTPATVGVQQNSPGLILEGQGWKTATTAASQPVKFSQKVIPVQGTTNPSGDWVLQSSINGGAYGTVLSVNSSSKITITPFGVMINRFDGNAGGISLTGDAPAQGLMHVPGGFKIQGGNPGTMDFTGSSNGATSGTSLFAKIYNDFQPTSGTATFALLELSGIVNQSGGANGAVAGLRINPSLIAAPDYRAIETAINIGHAIYQSGASASSYFAGEIHRGNATDQGAYGIQNTGGLYQNGTVSLNGQNSGTSLMKLVVKGDDSILYTIAGNTFFSNPMTTSADIIVGGASGVATRLAAGSANQVLGMNNGATAQEYKTITAGEGTVISNSAGAITIHGRQTGTMSGDGNFTIGSNIGLQRLIDITANRDVTMPTPTEGKTLVVWNTNTGVFAWNIIGSVVNAAGTALTTFVNDTTYTLIGTGSEWLITAVH